MIIFTFLVLLLARRDSKWSGILNFLVGAMVTLSLQVHAIGVMLAVTCSLFYLTELVFAYFDKERKVDLRPIIWFGIGALLGVGVHYVINVAPLGGYGEYLDLLRRDRPAHPMSPSFLTLNFYDVPTLYGRPDPLIRLLTWAGFLFMLWRRNKSDKILLHFVTILLIVTFIMDNIGYPVLYTSFFMIIAGSLLVDAFTTLRDKNVVSLRSFGMTVCVLIALVIPHLLREIHWDTLGNFLTTGDVPTLHDPFVEMGRILQEEYVQEDDIMISGANILWGMPDSEQLVSTEAEYYWKKIYGREYVRQFWDDLNATMYVHFNDTQFDFYLRYHEIDELLAHLQERNFQICDTFTVDPYSVEVYRPNCESAAESE